ncbi:iron-sulfur cluster assembly scaffold protein [uncultured Albimonas sp.]|uniref:iron-sulfur cluster assembly scaffold protein n=1 Tax=uncultured Albimonas sp. TaxID=1331701 RepID=UPI0030EE685A|tara:strand:- start:529 stop:999 length:471 start_codon:yes stop_codon:yes gene_type:complete
MTDASAEQDLIGLYSRRILALASEIPHAGRLSDPQASVKRRSPVCGSTVTVDLDLEDGRIARFAQDVKACALGQASAAVLGAQAVGRTREEIATAREQLRAMLKSDGEVPDAPFEGYEALLPARDYKHRHASILLAMEATLEAMDQAAGESDAARG